ncbi:MAG: hypothetical protein WBF47_20955, partial [Xanthobacteraceae bacterium]
MASLEYYRYAKIVLSLIAFVVIWQLACFIFKIPAYLLPAPSDIAIRLYEKRGLYFGHSEVTFYETVGGFLLAVVGGCIAATLIVVVPT